MTPEEDLRTDIEVNRFFLIVTSAFVIVLALHLCGPRWTLFTLVATAIPAAVITYFRVKKVHL